MKVVWLITGVLALGLGVLGIALPLLPTTPFVLLAAFAFARSSERMHRWLLAHAWFGPVISNWRDEGAISTGAKRLSVASMFALLVLSAFLEVPAWALGVQAGVLCACAAFILSRPSPPGDERQAGPPGKTGSRD